MAMVRIAFGLVIAVDAWFKWQSSFVHGFTNYLKSATDGQPQAVKDWINLVLHVVNINPHLFARIVALGETGVAIGLIFGVFSSTSFLIGALLTATIWSTAEGFGGPYKAGSTDVGAAIIYVFVFVALWISNAGRSWGLDRWLDGRLGRWSFLGSGRR
jgi:nitrite reductase (NO-forming)